MRRGGVLVAGLLLAACTGQIGAPPRALAPASEVPPLVLLPMPTRPPATIRPAIPSLDPVPEPTALPAEDFAPAGRRPVVVAPDSSALGHIYISAIGLDVDWFDGVDQGTLSLGPGHWPGRPLPGEPGNTVFGGHRTTYSRPFNRLDELQRGDAIVFSGRSGVATYYVDSIFAVYPDAIWITDPSGPDRATLFACHPKGSAEQRIVVVAYPDLSDTTRRSRSVLDEPPPSTSAPVEPGPPAGPPASSPQEGGGLAPLEGEGPPPSTTTKPLVTASGPITVGPDHP